MRTPRELIIMYWDRIWNDGEVELVREVCGDPMIRHDAMSITHLDHDEQIKRISHRYHQAEPYFTHEVLVADDTYVASVWNAYTRRGPRREGCGIEIFKVENGRLVDCWNSTYTAGMWGRAEPTAAQRPHQSGTAPLRTPRELMDIYTDRVWNEGEINLLREISADPIIRHFPEQVMTMSHDEQIKLVQHNRAELEPRFTHEVLLADDSHVVSVWNAQAQKGPRKELCGIDVFKAENGRLVGGWFSPHTPGHWGRAGDSNVPKDLPPPSILHSVDEMTPEWIQSMFVHAGREAPLVTFVHSAPIGNGNVNKTDKISINYNVPPKNVPETLVAKFHPLTPRPGGRAELQGYYQREAAVYTLFGENPPTQVPRVYFAAASDDGSSLNLLLEDLSDSCELGDQIAGCGQAEAAAVIHQHARLHSHFLNAPVLKEITWGYEKYIDGARLQEVYATGASMFHQRFADKLTKEEYDVIDGFTPLVSTWCGLEPEFATLIHGDSRVDNIIFATGQDGAPSAYLIDWQLTRIGDPQVDVAYFLTGSLSPEDRRSCEHKLITTHAKFMRETNPAYTDEKALAAHRLNAVAGLAFTVGSAVNIQSSPRADEMLLCLVKRNCAAVIDWKTLEALRGQ